MTDNLCQKVDLTEEKETKGMLQLKNIRALIRKGGVLSVEKVSIFVENDRIVRIDEENGADARTDSSDVKPDKVIDGKDRLAIPGLINTHTHAYMTLFRNVADDVPFTTWLFERVSPMEDNMTGEDAYWGTKLANLEMIRTGTTAYVDMHMNPHFCARAARESGLRAVLTRGLVGADRNDEGGLRRLNEFKEELAEWNDRNMTGFMLAPHAPYTCGPDYVRFISEQAKMLNLGIHIHLAEGRTEMENLKKDYGMTAIEYADANGAFDVPCLAAHCVHLTDSDMDILREKNVTVAANPASNMKLANGFSDVPSLLNKGVRVTLGTDGAASNNTLNLFREMTIEGLIHKGRLEDPESVSAREILDMVTVNGAAAIGRSEDLGEIAVGKKADIVIINLQNPGMNPYNDIISSLVYSSSGYEVETVMVDGKILMENNEFTTIDAERVYYETGKRIERIGGKVLK